MIGTCRTVARPILAGAPAHLKKDVLFFRQALLDHFP
jgi:hypothetical protein